MKHTVIRHAEHPLIPGMIEPGSSGCVSPEEPPPVPLESYELEEKCPECGVDPCACVQPEPELTVDLSSPRVRGEGDRVAVEAHLAAAQAFAARRQELLDLHGEDACVHPSRPDFMVARDLSRRFAAIADRLEGHPSAEDRARELPSVTSAGAILLTLFDQLSSREP